MLAAGVITNASISSAESFYSLTCQLPVSCLPVASDLSVLRHCTQAAALQPRLLSLRSLRQNAKTAVLDQMFVPGTKEELEFAWWVSLALV